MPAGCVPRLAAAIRVLVAILVALSAQTPHAGAQAHELRDYRITRWTTAEGLPQNTINDIAVLPNGELWLATFGGLVRFDGAAFQVVDIARDAALASNRITSLAQGEANTLWFVTQEGHLGRLDSRRVRTLVTPARPMRDMIDVAVVGGRPYAQSDEGTLWTADGTGTWQPVMATPTPGPGLDDLLARLRSHVAWASFAHVVVPSAPQPPPPPAPGRRSLPMLSGAVTRGAGRGLWLGLHGGVAHYRDDRFEVLDVRPAIDTAVSALLYVNEAEVWVAGDGVVSRVTARPDGSWRRSDLPLGLPAGVFIRSLAIDGEGSLWIGTSGRGLYRAHALPTRRFAEPGSTGAIIALVSDGAHGAWVSRSTCDGVFHLDDTGSLRQVHRSTPMDPGPGGCGQAFAAAEGGDVWVRVRDHLYRVSDSPTRVTPLPMPVPRDEGPIVVARDQTLWVVSRQGDVRRVSANRVEEQLHLPAPLSSAVLGPDGTLWVGGNGSVFHLVGGGRPPVRLGPQDGMPRGTVRDLLVDPDGTVWIATYGGGLGRWRNGHVSRFTVAEGLPDNSLSRILQDTSRRLWISTNRGIAVLDRGEIDRVADGAARMLTPVVFGAERGVPEANFGLPAGFAGADGRLWFGTIDGIVRIDAHRFPFNAAPPVMRVDGVLADDRELPLGPVVRIPVGTSRVRLNFGARALRYPSRMRFRFRIEGIDRQWVDVGAQRFAMFTPGTPGRHRFQLQARNEDGVWNTTPVVVDLDVLPAWWQTRVARLAGIVGIAVLAFGVYRHRVAAIERRHAERVRTLEDRRRSEEQASALRAQLEHVSRVALAGELASSLAHEVNQPLTAIVANAEAGEQMLAAGSAHDTELREVLHDIVAQGMRASDVIRELREFLRSGHPDPRPVDLSELVHDMLPLVRREFEDSGVHLRVDLALRLPPVEGRRVQLGQVVVNLLMNACEALVHVPEPRHVAIATRARDGRVEIVVTDNGPGLAPDVADRIFEPFVSTKPSGMGMGLAICRSIAEAHGGRLTAEAGEDRGLTVVLSLPAMNAAA